MIAAQWAAYRAKNRNHDPEHVWNLVVLGMILGIAGARAYYVIFEWPRFANQSIWMIINPATGGLRHPWRINWCDGRSVDLYAAPST
jgi:phosphatidylglycerol:prolipoprotein diacylglycerol transferase